MPVCPTRSGVEPGWTRRLHDLRRIIRRHVASTTRSNPASRRRRESARSFEFVSDHWPQSRVVEELGPGGCVPSTWATGCRCARRGMSACPTRGRGSRAACSFTLPLFHVVVVATLAAVAVAAGCSCSYTLPPLRRGRIVVMFEARKRETTEGMKKT